MNVLSYFYVCSAYVIYLYHTNKLILVSNTYTILALAYHYCITAASLTFSQLHSTKLSGIMVVQPISEFDYVFYMYLCTIATNCIDLVGSWYDPIRICN